MRGSNAAGAELERIQLDEEQGVISQKAAALKIAQIDEVQRLAWKENEALLKD
jgi:hypothetical protein